MDPIKDRLVPILTDKQKKIKRTNKLSFLLSYLVYFMIILLILGIARIWQSRNKSTKIYITSTKLSKKVIQGQFFGSVNGRIYYNRECKKGNTITKKNKIWFFDKEEAKKAGYQQSKYCQY